MNANLRMFTETNLSQQLNLAPQLLNWLKLLQVPTTELNQLIQSELMNNPALEASEPESIELPDNVNDDLGEFSLSDDSLGDRLSFLSDIDEEWRTADEPNLSSTDSLQEYNTYMMDSLMRAPSMQQEIEQAISCSDFSETDAQLANELAGHLNDKGYLEITLSDFCSENNISLSHAQTLLLRFQKIVPPGIGARDMEECLTLQLEDMEVDTQLAQRIVNGYLPKLPTMKSEELCELLEVDEDELTAARNQIRMLDLEPGLVFQSINIEYVQPDLRIWIEEGEIKVELCEEATPPLRISSYCKRLLEKGISSKSDLEFIRKKLREASFIIQGITQRQDTMLKVAQQIIRVQGSYFLKPNGELNPLTMNKVAAMIGVHETTVSRAVANKFISTPRGLIEMRAFFKAGYRCADGSAATPEKIKEYLSEFINSEEPTAPLRDTDLSDLLKKRGFKVARRTIAKYREELGIPSSKVRAKAIAC